MPPKSNKKKVVTPWDIALEHVGRAHRDAEIAVAAVLAGHKAGHLAGRIHEHALEYESPGWDVQLTELEPDEKGIARVKLGKHGMPTHINHAPQNTVKSQALAGFNGTLGKVRYTRKGEIFNLDLEEATSYAKTLKVGDSREWVIGAKNKISGIPEAYSMKVTHLEKKR